MCTTSSELGPPAPGSWSTKLRSAQFSDFLLALKIEAGTFGWTSGEKKIDFVDIFISKLKLAVQNPNYPKHKPKQSHKGYIEAKKKSRQRL